MAEKSTLLYSSLHSRECTDTMVSVHLHLPSPDRQHLEAAHVREFALYGSTPNGRNVDLGDMREPSDRSPHSPHPLYHRQAHDECASAVETCGSDSIRMQSCVSSVHSSSISITHDCAA